MRPHMRTTPLVHERTFEQKSVLLTVSAPDFEFPGALLALYHSQHRFKVRDADCMCVCAG